VPEVHTKLFEEQDPLKMKEIRQIASLEKASNEPGFTAAR
jgi:hypothetical protein